MTFSGSRVFPGSIFHLYLWVSGLYCDAVGPLAKVFEAQMQATHLAEHLQEEVETQTLEFQQKTTEAMEAKEYAELSSYSSASES